MNKDVITKLFEAIKEGNILSLKSLLEKGVDVNSKGTYKSLLTTMSISLLRRAVQHGHEEIVALLLDNGAKVKLAEKDVYKEPLLFCAIDKGNKEMVVLVLKKLKQRVYQSTRKITRVVLHLIGQKKKVIQRLHRCYYSTIRNYPAMRQPLNHLDPKVPNYLFLHIEADCKAYFVPFQTWL